MDAASSLHPTDQTLSSYGLGKLDDRSAEAVNKHLEQCQRLPETGRRDVGRQLPRTGPRRSEAFGQVDVWPVASRRDAERQGHERPGSASGQHAPAGPGRPPRLRDQAGTRPGRHGRGLPGPQHADGPRRGAQGDGAADHGTPRGARTLPPRDPGRRQAPPPQHRHGLPRHPARREHRLRDGVRRGSRPVQAGQGQGAAAGRPRLQLRLPGGPRAPARPRGRARPPRHQAGQPDALPQGGQGDGQGPRLRPGQGDPRGEGRRRR